MKNIESDRLDSANRLAAITQKIGLTLWQLQELEGIAALFLVLRTKAKLGMGTETANALLDKATSRNFGFTLLEISKAELFDELLQKKFDATLAERNWLVHKSRAASRPAIHNDDATQKLLERIDVLAENSMALMHEIEYLVLQFRSTTRRYSKLHRRTISTNSSTLA